LDLIDAGTSGQLVSVHNGSYGNVPLDVIIGIKKVVDVDTYYDLERLRPKYKAFAGMPLFIMTSDA
jgi:6-phosphofructokinase 1